ncbi:methyl-accepting chemotaxis protein [Halomonas sp. LS-001]
MVEVVHITEIKIVRNNQPVTQKEYVLGDDQILISRTNLKGQITYVNPAFVAVSGFKREELMGSHHNIVRHPDMPQDAYKDFWDTIQKGDIWRGVIKNRRKNGDHYWVESNATPIIENGQVCGYASMRIKPSPEQIRTAERVYAMIREGRRGYCLDQGTICRSGLFGWLGKLNLRSIKARITVFIVVATLMAALSGGISIAGEMGGIDKALLIPVEIGALAIGLIVLVLLGVTTARALTRPLDEARRFTLQIASGNLGATPPVVLRSDEIGRVQAALDIMRKSLGSIVGDVRDGVDQVTPSVKDIAAGNDDLSSRTEQQAASLQQTAASMEEITTTVKHNTDNARQVTQLASQNADRSRDSGEMMHRVVNTMDEITEGSRKIAEIVGLIDSIAFQTNILALNASVEAARAGEHGRGFAVVAQEVRNLATRSADAAKEIRGLINQSTHQINDGAELVRKAQATLTETVDAAIRVNDLMGEITSASEEQSDGISQVNDAVTQMDQVTQQNAARVQASAHAASELDAQTVMLNEAIQAFREPGAGAEEIPRKGQSLPPASQNNKMTVQHDGSAPSNIKG